MKSLLAALIISSLFLQCCKTADKKSEIDNPLTGSWSFIADQEIDSAGNVINQDTNVTGLLIYAPDGKMSIQSLWKGTRASIITDSIMKQDGVTQGVGLGSNSWSVEQARKLIDTYDAYFGDYSIDKTKNEVTHTITGNLRPEKPTSSYTRSFRIKGDTLFFRSTYKDMKWQTAWLKNKK
jgi:Lipocalin-like domain